MEIICRICRNTRRKKLIPLLKIVPNSNELEIEGEKFEYCLGLKILEISNYFGICTACEQQLNDFYTFKQKAIKSHYELLEITTKNDAINNDDTEKTSESLSDFDDLDSFGDDKDSLILGTMGRVITDSDDDFFNSLGTEEKEFENELKKIRKNKIVETDHISLEMLVDDDRDFPRESGLNPSKNEEEFSSSEMFNDEFDVNDDSNDTGSNTKMSNLLKGNEESKKGNELEFHEKTPKSTNNVQTNEQKIALPKHTLDPAENMSQIHCDVEIQKKTPQELKAQNVARKSKSKKTQNENGSKLMPSKRVRKKYDRKYKFKRMNCELCNRKFNNNEMFEIHMNKHKGLPAYQCDICGKTYNYESRDYYIGHMNDHKGIERRYKCELCPKGFHVKRALVLHLRFHNNERPFVCDTCGIRFTRHLSLKLHLRAHEHDNDMKCDICDKSFRSISVLVKHKKHVHIPRRFSCEICDKLFRRLHSLKIHIKKYHSNVEAEGHDKNKDEGPFVCKRCGEEFEIRKNLMFHLEICDIVKCDKCKRNLRKKTLEKHMIEVHGPNRFTCNVCNRGFTRRQSYKWHIGKHHNHLLDVLCPKLKRGRKLPCSKLKTPQEKTLK